jgi:2,4-dienoyl-CoA reductase-like NADH-dependent reductase (Old Yellow Enzyme family)
MNMSTDDGYVSDADIGFYEVQSKGGAGLIIVPHGFIDYPMGVSGPRRIALSDDKYIAGLTRLV